MCRPRSAKKKLDQRREQGVVGWPIRITGVTASRVLRSGSARRPGRRSLIGNHHQRPPAVLRLVPGVEQLLLVALLGLVEQPPADPLDEAAREQGPARAPRAGQDRRLDRPHAPFAEMVERLAVGVGDDEARVAVGLRPVERKRDLVRTPASFCARGCAGCGLRAGCGGCGGGRRRAAADGRAAVAAAACPSATAS